MNEKSDDVSHSRYEKRLHSKSDDDDDDDVVSNAPPMLLFLHFER